MPLRFLMGIFAALGTIVHSAHAEELDQWIEKLNAHCFFTPESKAGHEIPSMLVELKEHVFDAAGIRATGILEDKDATPAEKQCAQTVIGAIPTLRASVAKPGAAPQQDAAADRPPSVSADGKREEVQKANAEKDPTPVAAASSTSQKGSVSAVSLSAPELPNAQGESKVMDWENFVRKQWDVILAVYAMLLGAIAWRDQRGFDSRWKAFASKTALFTLALPLALIWLVLKGLWRFRREIVGGMLGGSGTQSSSPAPSAQSTSLQIDETVNIEIQDAGGGAWKKMTTAPNNPHAIRVAFGNVMQSPSVKKVRAVGSKTGQLYDFAG